MPRETSTKRLTVKSTVLWLSNGGFSFEAECEGKAFLCVNHPTFQGDWPNLDIDEKIVAEVIPQAFASSLVLYVAKIERGPGD